MEFCFKCIPHLSWSMYNWEVQFHHFQIHKYLELAARPLPSFPRKPGFAGFSRFSADGDGFFYKPFLGQRDVQMIFEGKLSVKNDFLQGFGWWTYPNHSNLTGRHPKRLLSNGNPLVSRKSSLVKYNLARWMLCFTENCVQLGHSMWSLVVGVYSNHPALVSKKSTGKWSNLNLNTWRWMEDDLPFPTGDFEPILGKSWLEYIDARLCDSLHSPRRRVVTLHLDLI